MLPGGYERQWSGELGDHSGVIALELGSVAVDGGQSGDRIGHPTHGHAHALPDWLTAWLKVA